MKPVLVVSLLCCAILSGCGTQSIKPTNLIKVVRDECVILNSDVSFADGDGWTSRVYTAKAGVYRAMSETEDGVFFAREGYPLSQRGATKSSAMAGVHHLGGGFFVPHTGSAKLKFFLYGTMYLQELNGRLINLGAPGNLPAGAENVDFSNGHFGPLGNAIAEGLVSLMRPADGTVVITTDKMPPEFENEILKRKITGDACKGPAHAANTATQ